MTQDEIIEMAREAGLETQDGFSESVFYFAKLVAAKEREACAKIADQISDKYSIGYYGSEVDAIDEVTEAIRLQTEEEFEPCPFVDCGCDGNHPKGKEAIRARGEA